MIYRLLKYKDDNMIRNIYRPTLILLALMILYSALPASAAAGNGTIMGVVLGPDTTMIGNATVTLMECRYDESTGSYTSTGLANVPLNPQQSNEGVTGLKGLYIFDYVPQGLYNITVEKNKTINYAIVNLAENSEAREDIYLDISPRAESAASASPRIALTHESIMVIAVIGMLGVLLTRLRGTS